MTTSVKYVAERDTGGLWHFPASPRGLFSRFFAHCGVVVISAGLVGCGFAPPIRVQLGAGDVQPISHFPAGIAADEPDAVVAAREIMRGGGTAADAAVTLAFVLTVTLPSRAGLGGGGICNMYDPKTGMAEVLDFTARLSASQTDARVVAATPTLPRGLFALHAKYGRLPWAQVVAPAEHMARFGVTVSRALATDLARDSQRLVNDRAALQTFMSARRQMLEAGDTLVQGDLAATLGRLRTSNVVGGGAFTQEIAVSASDVRDSAPIWIPAAAMEAEDIKVFSLPHRASGSTSFVISDTSGNIVACALSIGQILGTGTMAPNMGFLLAAPADSPSATEGAALVIAVARDNVVRYAIAAAGEGAGENAATVAGALAKRGVDVLREDWQPTAPALANVLACGARRSAGGPVCDVRKDARGGGHAIMINAGN